jgi:hypothetical protein
MNRLSRSARKSASSRARRLSLRGLLGDIRAGLGKAAEAQAPIADSTSWMGSVNESNSFAHFGAPKTLRQNVQKNSHFRL